MTGFTLVTKWFAQKIDAKFQGKVPRKFHQELNLDLLKELMIKVDELSSALEMGVGVVDAAVDVGSTALFIAFNFDRGVGKDKVARKEEITSTEDFEEETEEVDPATTEPGFKRGRGRPKTKK